MPRLSSVTGILLIAMASYVSSACFVGMSTAKYRPAQQPAGVGIAISTPQGKTSGELLALGETGIIVLIHNKVHMTPYSEILSTELDQTSGYVISNRTAPNADVKEHLRLLSRFPQGLTPELLVQLLQAYGQTEIATP